MTINHRHVVAWRSEHATYPEAPPFHPDQRFPEYDFPDVSAERNSVYTAVRDTFALAGLDAARFGSPDWNPLGELIRAGETVLLKPNLVKERHPRDPRGWRYVLTHGSVIRATADYIWKAVGPTGRVIVADAPQTDSSFSEIVHTLGVDRISQFYRIHGLELDLIDLRQEEWVAREGVIVERRKLPGDPRGGIAFDLGDRSEFADHQGAGHYYGADYDAGVVNYHHSGGRHQYMIAGSAIHCDVLFSLPKLKTHKKAGVTVSLKNLVGVNGDKNWLPHHTEGSPASGGDERPNPSAKQRVERALVSQFRRLSLRVPVLGPWLHQRARAVGQRVFGDTETVIRSGNWGGNDTVWRMALDLNKLILYGNPDGTFRDAHPSQRKRHFVLVDGIIAGEGSGPMNPDPVSAGLIVFGIHPASVDAACAYLIGFDPDRLPIVRNAFECRALPLAEWHWRDVMVISNVADWSGSLPEIKDEATFHFKPHFGWAGFVERPAQ